MFKTATLTLATLVASTSIAAADSYLLPFMQEQTADSRVELGTVRASGDGVVEIYSFHRGEIGELLGSEMVHAGANTSVNVNIGARSAFDVIALLKVNGEVVDSQEIEFN